MINLKLWFSLLMGYQVENYETNCKALRKPIENLKKWGAQSIKPTCSVNKKNSGRECFHEKDYLHHRYHAKRFVYLCIIKNYPKLSSPFSVHASKWGPETCTACLSRCLLLTIILLFFPVVVKQWLPRWISYARFWSLFLVADKLAEVRGFFERIIPTTKSLFNVAKLDLKRSNVCDLNKGRIIV